MTTSIEFAVPFLTALLGIVSGAYFQSVFEHRKQVKAEEHELKLRRYGVIIILMLTQLDPTTGMRHIREFRPDLEVLDDVVKEVEVELLNSILFAGDDVIKSVSEFIRKPSYTTYFTAVAAMRSDLWGKKTSVDEATFSMFFESKRAS